MLCSWCFVTINLAIMIVESINLTKFAVSTSTFHIRTNTFSDAVYQ